MDYLHVVFGVEVCTGPGLTRSPYPARPADRAGAADKRWIFQRAGPGRHMRDDFLEWAGPGRHMRGDFSNGPGREKEKRVFNGRIWLQKKEDE